MELTQLKYFLAAANTEHIAQAAEIMNVSQSAISMAIGRLEKELEVSLFEKKGRNIRLTENGRHFRELIMPAVSELDYAEKKIRAAHRKDPNTILLSVEIPDIAAILCRFFFEADPTVCIRQSMDTTETALRKIKNGSVDFCISYEPFRSADVVSLRILTEPVFIQLPVQHPLAAEPELSLRQLADMPFVSFAPEYSFRRWTDSMCFMAGFHPEICFEVCDTQSLIMIVRTHMACAFIGQSTHELNHNLSDPISGTTDQVNDIPLTDSFAVRNVYISYNKTRILSDEARAFLFYLSRLSVLITQTGSLFNAVEAMKEPVPLSEPSITPSILSDK